MAGVLCFRSPFPLIASCLNDHPFNVGFSLETAGIEVAFHKSEELREINWQEKETFLYANFLADFRGEFHDIRGDSGFAKCLDPNSYAVSQKLAGELLDKGSAGVVYP